MKFQNQKEWIETRTSCLNRNVILFGVVIEILHRILRLTDSMFIDVKKKIPFFKFFCMFSNPSTSTSFLDCVDDIFSKISSRINTFLFRQIRLECLVKDELKAVQLDTMFVLK